MERRRFLKSSLAASSMLGLAAASRPAAAQPATNPVAEEKPLPRGKIVDTHQHLWSVGEAMPPWLEGASEILRREYQSTQYLAASEGLDISAIYMEVDVAPQNHVAEAEQILALIAGGKSPTQAAVIGGRPAAAEFSAYVKKFAGNKAIKGVRQVLHGASTPRGYCLQPDFVRGVRLLGEHNLMYDLCMRPAELADAEQLISQVPETHFVLDHCGNADVTAFRADVERPTHDPAQWKRDIEQIAKHANVTCKISGIIARAPAGWQPADLAAVINHCLDCFGPQRVVFGSDWPVCRLGASLLDWVSALHVVIADRPEAEQRSLWADNAQRIYRLV